LIDLNRLIDPLIGREGGYVNDPRDSGGETIWGITERVARANGYTGPMRSMPRTEAVRIYRKRYIEDPGFGRIAEVSERVAEELIDTGANMGQQRAGEFLQTALNALNRRASDYPDVVVDGDAGPATRAALKAYLRLRGKDGETVLLRALNALQGARYIELSQARQKDEAFVFGWFRTRVEVPA
jgi:lysozyme family protein